MQLMHLKLISNENMKEPQKTSVIQLIYHLLDYFSEKVGGTINCK